MKRYVVIFLLSKDSKTVLLIKRNNEPFKNCYNGIGGKIENDETKFEAAKRECFEETNIDVQDMSHLMTITYPEGTTNNNTELNVFYSFVEKQEIKENSEGSYEWKDIDFAMNFHNKQLAGYGNISQILREILIKEGIIQFY